MNYHRKHQVSLRGASAREISRDALLEKVLQERELRSSARRASSSALLIQRVWRRYSIVKKEAERFRDEWEIAMSDHNFDREELISASWISACFLRPFLFFTFCLSIRCCRISPRDVAGIQKCLYVLLRSVNDADSRKNYCSLVLGADEERRTWFYQCKKLVTLCAFVLSKGNKSVPGNVALMTQSMRFLVVLTDVKAWQCITCNSVTNAVLAVGSLLRFIGSRESGFFPAAREYISKLDVNNSEDAKNRAQSDSTFLITASTVTLIVRPIQFSDTDPEPLCLQSALVQFMLFVLTIPWLCLRFPVALLAALRHKSILVPCFKTLLVLGTDLLKEMDGLKPHDPTEYVSSLFWSLANIISLVARNKNEFLAFGGIYHVEEFASLYVQCVVILSDNLLSRLDSPLASSLFNCEVGSKSGESYVKLFTPICDQWHLVKLVDISKENAVSLQDVLHPVNDLNKFSEESQPMKLGIADIARFYSNMLNIYSLMNTTAGSLPILNTLSFCPGYVANLWESLEGCLFFRQLNGSMDIIEPQNSSGNSSSFLSLEMNQKRMGDGGYRFANVLKRLISKSPGSSGKIDATSVATSLQVDAAQDIWDVESLRCGPEKLSKNAFCLLQHFCSTYAHLLLVLDDLEFYEKQVPFTLERQRRIASVLNTLVYHGSTNTINNQSKPLMESAIRCLNLLYERDCRHPFCPPALWLSPARNHRLPIAIAARIHGSSSSQIKSSDPSTQTMFSVISAASHVYPFEERVLMFREFVNMDKSSRKMAGEMTSPGSRAIEIVVRRSHIVEDGFRQLNSLGSKLKSSFHVSFVSENSLPEPGLDYGGLSKEFLTDITKAAFSPECGLFVQCSTSERLLVPNPAARYIDSGIQMIEFLGRIVGKALYEGILLDYSFSHVFVQKLLGRYSFVDELSTLDPELYRNLMYVKHYSGDVEDLSLDFTVVEESFGARHVIELQSGGKDISVTNENKMQYVHAMADYKLNRQILPFSNAFYRGLADIVSPSWLKLFNANEFNQLLSGGELDIDVDDLRKNTRYSGGYSEGNRTIKLFWEVLGGFKPRERCLLLKFVTSCSRAPLLGFKHLLPSFTIHKVAGDSSVLAALGGQDVERLPSASTCYNTLKLPTYKRASTMREKLLYAISSNTGFELS